LTETKGITGNVRSKRGIWCIDRKKRHWEDSTKQKEISAVKHLSIPFNRRRLGLCVSSVVPREYNAP
jgi:hypothetical protein